jgi:hypothetical protein
VDPVFEHHRGITRRQFLGCCNAGIGAIALNSLLGSGPVAEAAGLPGLPHFPGKAKRVIYIHLAGSPPQQDLFDYKPVLNELDGQPCPDEIYKNERFAFIKGHPKLLGSPHTFKQYGQAGCWVSNILPHFTDIVDDVCVVRSMFTDQFNHAPAQLFLYTGAPRPGRPSMGSWMTYGLGSENEDLPGFVVLVSNKTPDAGKSVWGSGFLPSVHQGVQCRTSGDPVLYLSDPPGMDRARRRRTLDALRDLNEMEHERVGDPEILTRIQQYELAYRMQISVPEVMNIADEPKHVLDMYGANPAEPSLANNCLLARRLSEKGVRFVQLFDWGWDVHGASKGNDIVDYLPEKCQTMDRPVAALVKDLKQRGLLDETLVVWSGEFGRTAMNEERDGSKYLGRDHHPHAFTIWLAGGGIKQGAVVGETDDFSYKVVDTPVHIHDLQATILHLMGINHEKFTYRFEGRDYRLTDVHGRVVPELLA